MSHTQRARESRGISRRTFVGSAAVASLGLMGGSCPPGSVTFPQVKEVMPALWDGGNNATKFLEASVENVRPGANIVVSVGVSRHRPWSGSAEVRHFVVQRDPPRPDEPADTTTHRFTFRPPHPEDYRDSQLVFFKWFVDVTQDNGDQLLLSESPQRSFRIGGFTPARTDEWLRNIQDSVVPRFDQPTAPEQHGLPTHLHRCLRGMGMTFLRYGKSLSGPINLMEPQLLMYVKSEDDRWRLMGWAYGTEHTGIDSHPIAMPIPWEAWFVHEAGWHPPNGGFIPTPPSSDVPRGSKKAPAPAVPVGLNGVWHPRIWDLHVFRRDGGTPIMAIEDPSVARDCEDWDSGWFFDAPDVDVQPRE